MTARDEECKDCREKSAVFQHPSQQIMQFSSIIVLSFKKGKLGNECYSSKVFGGNTYSEVGSEQSILRVQQLRPC